MKKLIFILLVLSACTKDKSDIYTCPVCDFKNNSEQMIKPNVYQCQNCGNQYEIK
jgi:hypothetical protein